MIETEAEGDSSTPSTAKIKICRGCNSEFTPSNGRFAYCTECKISQQKNQAPKQNAKKRSNGHMSPAGTQNAKKDKSEATPAQEDSVVQKGDRAMDMEVDMLLAMKPEELVELILELRGRFKESGRSLSAMDGHNRKLQREILEAKVAFADQALLNYRQTGGTSYAAALRSGSATHDEGNAKLVAKVDTSKSDQPIDLCKMDSLLRSDENGPVAQNVQQKEGQIVLTFSDMAAREAAKKIMESSEECKKIFTSVSSSSGYYPVLARFLDLRPTEEEITMDIRRRNPVLKDSLKSFRVVYRNAEAKEGHAILWITSRSARDIILSRGEIFVTGRRCRVMEADLHKEIRRCYRCQQYGHLLRDCRATADVCGKCSGAHRTSTCEVKDAGNYRCSNCKRRPSHLKSYSDGRHQAGDRLCPDQIKALNRFKRNHGL